MAAFGVPTIGVRPWRYPRRSTAAARPARRLGLGSTPSNWISNWNRRSMQQSNETIADVEYYGRCWPLFTFLLLHCTSHHSSSIVDRRVVYVGHARTTISDLDPDNGNLLLQVMCCIVCPLQCYTCGLSSSSVKIELCPWQPLCSLLPSLKTAKSSNMKHRNTLYNAVELEGQGALSGWRRFGTFWNGIELNLRIISICSTVWSLFLPTDCMFFRNSHHFRLQAAILGENNTNN